MRGGGNSWKQGEMSSPLLSCDQPTFQKKRNHSSWRGREREKLGYERGLLLFVFASHLWLGNIAFEIQSWKYVFWHQAIISCCNGQIVGKAPAVVSPYMSCSVKKFPKLPIFYQDHFSNLTVVCPAESVWLPFWSLVVVQVLWVVRHLTALSRAPHWSRSREAGAAPLGVGPSASAHQPLPHPQP